MWNKLDTAFSLTVIFIAALFALPMAIIIGVYEHLRFEYGKARRTGEN